MKLLRKILQEINDKKINQSDPKLDETEVNVEEPKLSKKSNKESKRQPITNSKNKKKDDELVELLPSIIDLRVGKIIDVQKHPEADLLYVEKIDFGEEEPRTVSFAMVLAASSKDGKDGMSSVELVEPPIGSEPGNRVYFEGFESGKPINQLNPKKKQFESIQPNLTRLETRECCSIDVKNGSKVHRLMTDLGPCKTQSLIGASLL
ncbi:hypothetical protein BY996DRAFT_8452396 [Phakopsora pachyrhizi]|nr:hypothetical protein BY996DRAFT_8452389 [Phakopsora pachyrhizi]KAI8456172.1 hypothetical protein BY996DRAFT_8452396 [Phakopsora pachyrhizi]